MSEESGRLEGWLTATGKVLTEEDVEKLADEAERGYCTQYAMRGTGHGMCGRPLNESGECDRVYGHREAP